MDKAETAQLVVLVIQLVCAVLQFRTAVKIRRCMNGISEFLSITETRIAERDKENCI